MKARFSTKCSVCDALIEKGKEIVKNEDENWVHKHCANEILEIPYFWVFVKSYIVQIC